MVKICVLGAGNKPLSNATRHCFPYLSGVGEIRAINVDILPLDTTDHVCDLNKPEWRLGANEFDIVIAEHVAEHMKDRIAFVRNCLKIAKPNGLVIIEVPNWSHETAHSNLEHLTTFSRCIFDDSYINHFGKDWKVEAVVYRLTNPITWTSYYLHNEFIGRQLDKYTRLISGLRFYLRKP